ncbi:hypothetical protein ACLOJK_030701 [Asimina triloba]
MDEYTGKRTAGGLSIARSARPLSLRDSSHEDRSVQYCNRIACSTRVNPVKAAQMGNPERSKCPRHSFRSSSSKAIVGSSSKPFTGISDLKRPYLEQHDPTVKGIVLAENSSGNIEAEDPELVTSTSGIQSGEPGPEDTEAAVLHGISGAMEGTDACIAASLSNVRPRRQGPQQAALSSKDTSPGLSVRRSFSSRHVVQGSNSTSQGPGTNTSRYALRNLGCASISDVLASGCSSSDSGRSKRPDMAKRRCPPEGESSLSRGKSSVGAAAGGSSGSQRNDVSNPCLSFTERPMPQPASRRTRNWSAGSNGVASVRTRRTVNGESRLRLSEAVSDNGLLLPEPIVVPQLLPQTEFVNSESVPGCSSQSIPTEFPPVCQTSYGQSSSSNGTLRIRPIVSPEDSSGRPFHSFSVQRDSFRRFHMEGIAEVLLALDRIEQDAELTYEAAVNLTEGVYVRITRFGEVDMGVEDIGSNWELLALEEKMGNVSTALSEEELAKCLQRSCYVSSASMEQGYPGHGDDDTKCSICQEEYIGGDEVGKLSCEHAYHVVCIHQWLRQKNWCPICKASASAS